MRNSRSISRNSIISIAAIVRIMAKTVFNAEY
jgi:hypothetical protein